MESSKKAVAKLPRHRRSIQAQHSSDNEHQPMRRVFPPLHLSREQLMVRLNTLKDYPTYKRTKAKRINLGQILQREQTNITDTALAFGSKEGHHQVLTQFIQNQNESEPGQPLNKFQEMLEDSRRRRIKPKLSQEDPSFISYKSTDEKERPKINKMVNLSHSLHHSKSRNKTELKEHPIAVKKHISFPRELSLMKKRLSLLPVLNQQSDGKSSHNPENRDEVPPTISLASNANQEHEELIIQEKIFQDRSRCLTGSNVSSLIGRQEYIDCVRSILDRSGTLLSGEEDNASLRSSGGGYSEYEVLSKSEANVETLKKRKYRYWPTYPKYSLSQNDNERLKKLAKQSSKIATEQSDVVEQVRELDELIKGSLQKSEKLMAKDILEKEINNLENRYKYMIQLEQEKRKRTAKELIQMKKDFYLSSRKEQIRANGIKRFKKLPQNSSQKKATAALSQSQH